MLKKIIILLYVCLTYIESAHISDALDMFDDGLSNPVKALLKGMNWCIDNYELCSNSLSFKRNLFYLARKTSINLSDLNHCNQIYGPSIELVTDELELIKSAINDLNVRKSIQLNSNCSSIADYMKCRKLEKELERKYDAKLVAEQQLEEDKKNFRNCESIMFKQT